MQYNKISPDVMRYKELYALGISKYLRKQN